MKLRLCDTVERNEYLSSYDLKELKETIYDYFTNHDGKSDDIVDNYLNYSYKTYDSLKFVSLMLIQLDNQPYFIEEVFYNKDKSKIFMQGEYKKVKYNFVLE